MKAHIENVRKLKVTDIGSIKQKSAEELQPQIQATE